MNLLEYPDTCVKGVGSTIRHTLRGGLRVSGGASFDSDAVVMDDDDDDEEDVD